MAMTYQNFASLGVNLNRQKYGPLDISNVFTSEADLKYYLSNGTFTEGVSEYWYKDADTKVVPYPYEGQVLATVIDGVVNVYTLVADEFEADGTTIKSFKTAAVGAEPDGKTVRRNSEGKLELVGIPTDVQGKTYVPSLVNGQLSWAEPDTSTAEGQQQAIEGIAARTTALESAVGNESAGLVKDVADNKQAIADEKTRAEAAEKALGERIDAIDFVDPEELAGAIKDFATKAYVDGEIDTLEATIAGLNHFEAKVVDSIDAVKDLGVLYLIKDTSVTGVDKYNEYIVVDDAPVLIGDTTTDLSDYYNKTEIDGKVETLNTTITTAISGEKTAREALAREVEATYYTKGEFSAFSAALETNLADYAKTADVDTELADKVDAGTIAHAVVADPENGIEAIPEGVTREGTTLKIVVDAPTRAETLQMIADKLKDIAGEESIPAVKADLEAEVARSTAKDSAHDAALETLTGSATTAGSVAEAKAQADKGVADAAKVAGDLNTAKLTIADNTREIGVAKSSIEAVNNTLTEKITAFENKDAAIESNITALQTVVSGEGGHASRITSLESSVSVLTSKDTELAGKIDLKANSADVYTKTEIDKKLSDSVGGIDLTPYAKTADVNQSVETINAVLATKAVATEVYTIAAADAKFQTEAQVDARISAVIDAANNEDTIKNVQDLVSYVNDNAGDIAALVTTVEGHATTIGEHTQKLNEIDATIVALRLPKASDEISVGNDGTLGIIGMSTDKLTQGTMTLVLDGGDASEVTTA